MRRTAIFIAIFLLLIPTEIKSETVDGIELPNLILFSARKENSGYCTAPSRYTLTFQTTGDGQLKGISNLDSSPLRWAKQFADEFLMLSGEEDYILSYDVCVPEPDSVVVFSWDMSVIDDVEHAGDYQKYPDGVIYVQDNCFTMKPNRIYSIQLKWEESEKENSIHGFVEYFIMTSGRSD